MFSNTLHVDILRSKPFCLKTWRQAPHKENIHCHLKPKLSLVATHKSCYISQNSKLHKHRLSCLFRRTPNHHSIQFCTHLISLKGLHRSYIRLTRGKGNVKEAEEDITQHGKISLIDWTRSVLRFHFIKGVKKQRRRKLEMSQTVTAFNTWVKTTLQNSQSEFASVVLVKYPVEVP